MLWAQWAYILLFGMAIGVDIERWGKQREPRIYGGRDLVVTFVAIALVACAGGLNRIIGWPNH